MCDFLWVGVCDHTWDMCVGVYMCERLCAQPSWETENHNMWAFLKRRQALCFGFPSRRSSTGGQCGVTQNTYFAIGIYLIDNDNENFPYCKYGTFSSYEQMNLKMELAALRLRVRLGVTCLCFNGLLMCPWASSRFPRLLSLSAECFPLAAVPFILADLR